MQLTTNIKPIKVIGDSKKSLLRNSVKRTSITSGSIQKNGSTFNFSGFTPIGIHDTKITVINFHKVRKKSLQEKGKSGKTKSKVIKRSHWIGYVYSFEIDFLINLGYKSIEQKSRNFELKK